MLNSLSSKGVCCALKPLSPVAVARRLSLSIGGKMVVGVSGTTASSCCAEAPPTASAPSQPGDMQDTYEVVKEYYGKVLSTSKDLKTGACTAGGRPPLRIREIINQIPSEVKDKFYGCGAPLPLGIQGLNVLDLGSGSGRDCYVCSALVGETGSVIGIDMTQEQIQVAERHTEWFCKQVGYSSSNMRFINGHIEYLDKAGIADESVDLIISNCVVNLSPDKQRVINEAYRVLRPGGEFYFSDVYCDRRVPEHVQKHEVLWGECISGALYVEDFKRLAREAGFTDPRSLQTSPIPILDPQLQEVVGNARFYSITFRLFKLPGQLETLCEDYGQVATYKGTIEGNQHSYQLDNGHSFETGRPALVCGNTAAMLGEGGLSWLSAHFEVTPQGPHHGLFAACASSGGPSPSPSAETQLPAPGGSCC